MRKFWVVLLSIGLIVAFTMPVCAADVKFSGSYVAQGYYENNRSLKDPEGAGFSNVWQRLRVNTVFKVQEGLTLTTQFDALEKIWGAARQGAAGVDSGAPTVENDNIKFEQAYVSFNLPVGAFRAGYQQQGVFGTSFADADSAYGPRVRYDLVTGPIHWLALWDKVEGQKDYSTSGPAGTPAEADKDQNKYDVAFWYTWNSGNAGLLFIFLNDASAATSSGYKRRWYVFDPYVKATFGPVYVEAEAMYVTGKTRQYEDGVAGTDIKKNSLSAYVMVMGNFGPAYAGLAGVWVPGDNDATDDKDKSGYPGSNGFQPCLMLWNYDLARWNGNFGSGSVVGGGASGITNALVGQIFGGIKPIPKLDIKLSYTYAKADKVVTGWDSKDYGSELDLTATYKIYDNLSYMIGGAYLFTGDYWKGTNANAQVGNDYLLTHKLALTF